MYGWLGATPRQQRTIALCLWVHEEALCEARAPHFACCELQGLKCASFWLLLDVLDAGGQPPAVLREPNPQL